MEGGAVLPVRFCVQRIFEAFCSLNKSFSIHVIVGKRSDLTSYSYLRASTGLSLDARQAG